MKDFLLSVGVIICSTFSFSQSLEHQDFLVEFLGQDRFDRIMDSNPSYLNYLDTRCSEGYIIMDYIDEKMSQMDIPVVDLFVKKTKQNGKDLDGTCKGGMRKEELTPNQFLASAEDGTLNILAFDFDYDKSKVIYYKIGSTGKMIAIYPADYIAKKVSQNQ